MDFNILIYLVLFLLVIVLIFKVIKKVMFAIFTVMILMTLIVAGIGGLVYMDYKDLSNRENFDMNFVYGSVDEAEFGISLPYDNGEMDPSGIQEIDVDELNEDFLDDNEEDFYIFVDKKLFDNMLVEDKKYYLQGTKELDLGGTEMDTSLTKQEVLDIIESKNSNEDYVNILLEQNDLGDSQEMGEVDLGGVFEEHLEENFEGVTLREVLFISILTDLDENSLRELLVGFKEEKLMVYPDKFSFDLIRMMPLDMLTENLEFNSTSVEE